MSRWSDSEKKAAEINATAEAVLGIPHRGGRALLTKKQRSFLRAISSKRAAELFTERTLAGLPLEHDSIEDLRASIAKHAVRFAGCGASGPRQDEVDMIRDAIQCATVDADGRVAIPEEEF